MSNMVGTDASSSCLISDDFPKAPITVNEPPTQSETFLPKRKFANLDLATLCDSADEDTSCLAHDSSDDKTSDESDGEVEIGDEVHELRKSVVSPLITQVESAYANLRKTDNLFGTMDDFETMMDKASLLRSKQL